MQNVVVAGWGWLLFSALPSLVAPPASSCQGESQSMPLRDIGNKAHLTTQWRRRKAVAYLASAKLQPFWVMKMSARLSRGRVKSSFYGYLLKLTYFMGHLHYQHSNYVR